MDNIDCSHSPTVFYRQQMHCGDADFFQVFLNYANVKLCINLLKLLFHLSTFTFTFTFLLLEVKGYIPFHVNIYGL